MIRTTACPAHRPAAILDLDGTVVLGNGPALAYADEAFRLLGAAEESAHRDLAAWMAGEGTSEHADAYSAVTDIAAALSVEELQQAYDASRRRLAAGSLGETTPSGLPEALSLMRSAGLEIVLMTNSPETGIAPLLERLGLTAAFDQVVVNAGKPIRVRDHLATLLQGEDPHGVLSVGDHYANDVAPVIAAGGVGMLITDSWRSRAGSGPAAARPVAADADEPAPGNAEGAGTGHAQSLPAAHAVAPSLDALLPAIRAFCADVTGYAASHPLVGEAA